MAAFWHVLYNIALSLWIGGISIFTFVITPVIFRSFERDVAGEIVGRLFTAYFLYALLLSIIALLLFLASGSQFGRFGYRWSLALIAVAIVMNLFVSFHLHPEIKKIKQQIHSFGDLKETPLRKQFGKLHGVSAVLNLLLLADGVALLCMSTVLRK